MPTEFVDMHTTMSTVNRIYAHRVCRHAYYYVYRKSTPGGTRLPLPQLSPVCMSCDVCCGLSDVGACCK